MTAYVSEVTFALTDSPGIRYAFAAYYTGYLAKCAACDWTGDPHGIGLESAPNAVAIDDADEHNRQRHR